MTDLRARDSPLLSRLCACMHGRPAFLVRINPTGHLLSLSAPFLHFSTRAATRASSRERGCRFPRDDREKTRGSWKGTNNSRDISIKQILEKKSLERCDTIRYIVSWWRRRAEVEEEKEREKRRSRTKFSTEENSVATLSTRWHRRSRWCIAWQWHHRPPDNQLSSVGSVSTAKRAE